MELTGPPWAAGSATGRNSHSTGMWSGHSAHPCLAALQLGQRLYEDSLLTWCRVLMAAHYLQCWQSSAGRQASTALWARLGQGWGEPAAPGNGCLCLVDPTHIHTFADNPSCKQIWPQPQKFGLSCSFLSWVVELRRNRQNVKSPLRGLWSSASEINSTFISPIVLQCKNWCYPRREVGLCYTFI